MDISVTRSALLDASLEQLWPLISDTNRLNRMAGLGYVRFEPLDSDSAARYVGEGTMGGLPVRYEELPFEWERPRWFRIRRRMIGGLVSEFGAEFRLDPEAPAPGQPDRTRLSVTIQGSLRWGILTPIMRVQAGQGADNLIQAVRTALAAEQAGGRVGAPPALLPGIGAVEARIGAEGLGARLVRWVREAVDEEVGRLRPFPLADQWGVDRRDLLAACMDSVSAGLLVMRWEVICPGCRQSPRRMSSLAEIAAEERCHACDLAWTVSFEDSVEATFSPAPAVRAVDYGPWCSGGPGWSPHVTAQVIAAPGATVELPVPDLPGHCRVSLRGLAAVAVDALPGAPELLDLDPAEPPAALPAVAPGGRLRLRNRSARELHARVDRLDAPDLRASARVVTAMPGFRERFSADILRPGLSMDIRRMTLFFSDLADSTRLYADIGDAAAFRVVQDHFDVLIGLIRRHRGEVVKTIGDAVMAVFADEDDGLRACAAILAAFEPFVTQTPDRARTHIKLGLYSGPCFAAEANGRLDYFGQSVNIAARLQGLAGRGECVIEARCADRLAPDPALPALSVDPPEEARLKGVRDPVRVVRLRVAPDPAGSRPA